MSPPNFPQRLIEITAKPGEGADGLNHPVTMRGIKSDIEKLNIVLTTGEHYYKYLLVSL